MTRPAAAVTCACLILANSAAALNSRPAASDRESSEPFVAIPELDLYHTANRSCGVAAAYVTIRLCGVGTDLPSVARAVPVSVSGTSLAQLREYFEQQGLFAEPLNISAPSLSVLLKDEPETRAIALLDENHWVALALSDADRVAYFDYPSWRSTRWSEFADRFSGIVLLVRPQASIAGDGGLGFWRPLLPILLCGFTLTLYAYGLVRACRRRWTFRSHSDRSLDTSVTESAMS